MNTKRNGWTPAEDEVLLNAFNENGKPHWRYAEYVSKRLGRTIPAVYTRVTDLRDRGLIGSKGKTVEVVESSAVSIDSVISQLESLLVSLKIYKRSQDENKKGIIKRIVDIFS